VTRTKTFVNDKQKRYTPLNTRLTWLRPNQDWKHIKSLRSSLISSAY